MTLEEIKSTRTIFEYYKSLGEGTFVQLNDEQLFTQLNPASNSIAIITNHLHGNMLSRWTNFLTQDGEKEWRKRDAEFESSIKNRKELLLKWEAGWSCLFEALDSIEEKDLKQLVFIRNQGHTIFKAIQRQLGHYAYHVGQIVFIGKALQNDDWATLSIAKGGSEDYNDSKFNEEKRKEHFSQEFTKKK